MNENDGCWPEQEAVDQWFEAHSFSLKDAVTKERLKIQRELEDVKKEKEELVVRKVDLLVKAVRELKKEADRDCEDKWVLDYIDEPLSQFSVEETPNPYQHLGMKGKAAEEIVRHNAEKMAEALSCAPCTCHPPIEFVCPRCVALAKWREEKCGKCL